MCWKPVNIKYLSIKHELLSVNVCHWSFHISTGKLMFNSSFTSIKDIVAHCHWVTVATFADCAGTFPFYGWFNQCLDYITSKANSTLSFLRHNINISNPHVKEQSYTTLVRPVLEYSQTVWDPYTAGWINKIESVQRRAARFTLSRYRRTSSVSAMLAELNWQTLAERRRLARLTMFYKIHYNLVAITMPLSSKLYSCSTRTENI